MKVLSNRTRRVGENIRLVLSDILLSKQNSIDGLENEFITITEVQPTADLRLCKSIYKLYGKRSKKCCRNS